MATCAKGLPAAALACLLCVQAPGVSGAGISVPSLELVTHGSVVGDVFTLQTRGSLELAVEGGSKFGGRVQLGYTNAVLEPSAIAAGLDFQGLSITVRDPAASPLGLSFFVGESDIFCSGDAFTSLFGARPLMTSYRGFLTFPNGITSQPNNAYDGIHEIKGTGLRFDIMPDPGSLLFSFYGYQDSHFTQGTPPVLLPGYFSGDFRAVAALGPVKLEGFVGATYSPVAALGYYRGGLLFHAEGPGVEFLAEIGLPRFDPLADSLTDINLLYVLFEPRLHLGLFSLVPTFFWHPGYYLQQSTGERGSFDVNINMYLGDLETTSVQGGIEGTLRFVSAASAFTVDASPYVSFVTPGVLWDLKMDVRLGWPLGLENFSGIVGIRAEL